MSIDQNDIRPTYNRQRESLRKIISSLQAARESAENARQAVVKMKDPSFNYEDKECASSHQYRAEALDHGCMDFNPVPDADHPVLKMSIMAQVVDAEIGGGKINVLRAYHGKPVGAHRILRNYELNDGTRVRIGDYLVRFVAIDTGAGVFAHFEKEKFEKQFKPVLNKNGDYPAPERISNAIAHLEKENAELRDLLVIARENGKKFALWFLDTAATMVNSAEDLQRGADWLDDHVLR